MISIDWDFFFWRFFEAHHPPNWDQTRMAEAFSLWDWGSSEDNSVSLDRTIWSLRWAGFVRLGWNPLRATGHATHLKGITPATFVKTLNKKLKGQIPEALLYSDSHMMGYYAVKAAVNSVGRPIDIVHFDAHHDLGGYSKGDHLYLNCASWLYLALKDDELVRKVTVVYPDWRDWTGEDFLGDDKLNRNRHLIPYRDRLKRMTWSEWAMRGRLGTVEAINVARSGAWSPIWFDKRFRTFIRSLPHEGKKCMDCARNTRQATAFDACKPREWTVPVLQPDVRRQYARLAGLGDRAAQMLLDMHKDND
jgi:hypothetical protein